MRKQIIVLHHRDDRDRELTLTVLAFEVPSAAQDRQMLSLILRAAALLTATTRSPFLVLYAD